MAFAGHRSCGFCILVLTSITPWLPRIYQTNSKPWGWGGFRHPLFWPPYLEELSIKRLFLKVPVDVTFPETMCKHAQAGLRRRHFGSVAERSKEEERSAVLPAFATPRCIPVARTAVLLACPCSFRLSGQQDSKTRAAVLLTRALDRWLLVTSQLFASEKMLRPKGA